MRLLMMKAMRFLSCQAPFFLPKAGRLARERRMRGREEARKLALADTVIVSFGKSGRTWLRVMLSGFYQTRHDLPPSAMIGFDNLHRKNADVPKIFFTHDNYLKDFTGHAEDKRDYRGKKVILLARHPADVAVSQFYQWKFRMRPHKKEINGYPAHGTDVGAFDFVMRPDAGLPKIVDFMNLWANEAGTLENLLLVKYEDMKADAERELGRMLEFLGTPGNPEEIRAAVEYSSFDNMRKMEQKRTFWLSGSRMVPKDRANTSSFKTRKGKVGGYRDEFTAQEAEEIDRYVQEHLSAWYGWSSHEARAAEA